MATYKIEFQEILMKKLFEQFNELEIPLFVQEFFLTLKSANTKVNYWYVVRDFLKWKYDNLSNISQNDIKQLSQIDVINFINYIKDKKINEDKSKQKSNPGYRLDSIRNKVMILASFSNYLVDERMISKPFVTEKTINLYKFKIREKDVLMPKEHDLITFRNNLENIKSEMTRKRMLLVYDILIATGLRIHELVGLDLSDLFLDNDEPQIKILRKGSYEQEEMENIYIPLKIKNEIINWINYRSQFHTESNALLIGKNLKRTTEDNIKKMFRKYSDGKISPHMLRHYYATDLLHKTQDIVFVQQQLGHRLGSSVTTDVYIASMEESKKKLLDM